MDPIKDGYSAPFIRLYYKGEELSANVTSFRYVMDEEDSDEIELRVEVESRDEPDKPYYQEDEELTVVWGFIGEANKISNISIHAAKHSTKKKIWIRDPRWSFSKENIIGTLMCTEKGSDLKTSSSKTVYKNKTIAHVANEVADKHGLIGYMEIPSGEKVEIVLQPIPGEKLDEFLIRNRIELDSRVLQEKLKNPEKTRKELSEILKSWKDPGKKFDYDALNNKYPKLWADTNFLALNSLKVYNNLPQANKSDLQVLKSMASREKDGPWVVETREDELILKKRDFLKTPYATYEYGGSDGRLLEFNPESKKRGRKGTSGNVAFSGWNPLNKTFFSGTVNPADGSPALAKALEMLQYYKGVQKFGGGKLITGKRIGKQVLPFINQANVENRIDNAGVYTRLYQKANITVDDKVSALEKAIKDYGDKKAELKKDIYNALGINPIDSANSAGNSRRESELKKNQVTATIWGDINITCGMIITITGVSKKYNGNYYIFKATHTIAKGEAYLVELELGRHGHNIKVNEQYADHKDLGRSVNKKVGAEVPNSKTHEIPIKTNPGKQKTLREIFNLGQ